MLTFILSSKCLILNMELIQQLKEFPLRNALKMILGMIKLTLTFFNLGLEFLLSVEILPMKTECI
jgi:hypothetical protein